jgi:hypothetical protein
MYAVMVGNIYAFVEWLYLSLDRKTVEAEFRYYQTKGGCNPDLAECYSFRARVNLARVLDLRSRDTRKLFDLSVAKILVDWEPDPLVPSPPSLTRPIRNSCAGTVCGVPIVVTHRKVV